MCLHPIDLICTVLTWYQRLPSFAGAFCRRGGRGVGVRPWGHRCEACQILPARHPHAIRTPLSRHHMTWQATAGQLLTTSSTRM